MRGAATTSTRSLIFALCLAARVPSLPSRAHAQAPGVSSGTRFLGIAGGVSLFALGTG